MNCRCGNFVGRRVFKHLHWGWSNRIYGRSVKIPLSSNARMTVCGNCGRTPPSKYDISLYMKADLAWSRIHKASTIHWFDYDDRQKFMTAYIEGYNLLNDELKGIKND